HQNSKRRGGPFAESERDAQGGTWLARSIPSAIPDKGARLLVFSTQAGLPNVLRVPALHERPEDIPLLVDGFLKEFNREHGRRVTGITRGALEQLAAYD